MKTKKIKGADIVIKCLEKANIDTIFAYPGAASMELHQSLMDSNIRVILPRHEQGGAFAAAGMARATGETGVVMTTSGPGATNLLTGIADAYMDSIPLVVITGQTTTNLIGKTAFQEIDIVGMTTPIVKHSFLVLDVNDIPAVFKQAFELANSGRPGPVLIDLPKNIQQDFAIPKFTETHRTKVYSAKQRFRNTDIEAIKEAISLSSKPCICAGGGIITSSAARELKIFAESYNIPVVTTLMGIGAFPETNPLSLKFLGMHGTVYANNAVNECDLLIVLGARLNDRVTGPAKSFAKNAKIIHVDIDKSELNKNVYADISVQGNVKDILEALNKEIISKEYKQWFAQIDKWKNEFPLSYNTLDTGTASSDILPQAFIEEVYKQTKGQAVIVPGVGQHQMWASQFYKYTHPRQLLTSGGLGTMGFDLPSAMGAKIALPESIVIAIAGDGSVQMNIQELGTIHNENIDIKIIILNNQHLGMVAQWEDKFYGSRRGNTELGNKNVNRPYPDFVRLANSYGIAGREVYKADEMADAIQEMLQYDGAFILDVHTKYQEHVIPMWPPGVDYKGIITN